MLSTSNMPVAVVGAGPVGLAAAAHLLERGLTPLVLEAEPSAGGNVRRWAHVRVFSPWEMNLDAAAVRLLERAGWEAPEPDGYPTGAELVERYLEPLRASTALRPHVRLGARVLAITRAGIDKLRSDGRDDAPFELVVASHAGVERVLARAVIDASGTVATPNPLGAGGVAAVGEEVLASAIEHGHPDVLGRERGRYAGRRVLVAGSGHSALGALLDLLELRREEPATRVTWALRRSGADALASNGAADALPQRGRLASAVAERLGELDVVTGFATRALERDGDAVVAVDGERRIGPFDRVVAATGYRPDLSLLRELRVELDPWVESPPALAPLIDPNVHSCGTVPPHGARELAQPEPGLYVAGMKSYGRAPTFLMRTGYEQVRSIAAELAGDREAAERVELVLPETGACSLAALPVAGAAAGAARGCC